MERGGGVIAVRDGEHSPESRHEELSCGYEQILERRGDEPAHLASAGLGRERSFLDAAVARHGRGSPVRQSGPR